MDFKAELQEWHELRDYLGVIKDQEDKMRRKLFAEYFPAPEKGVNTIEFSNDYKLKGTPKINVTVDQSMLQSVGLKLGADIMDKLIKWKPEPVNKEVKLLTDKQRHIFESTLVMKPGMPELKLVAPKGG